MQQPSILLVEDSEDDAFLFTHAFRQSGLPGALHYAADGTEAVQFITNAASSNTLPQVIFLDLKMPVMNGFDFLDWLRKQTFRSGCFVVVLSGSDQRRDKERAAELGASDYLVKPIALDDLHRIIGENGLAMEKTAGAPNGARS